MSDTVGAGIRLLELYPMWPENISFVRNQLAMFLLKTYAVMRVIEHTTIELMGSTFSHESMSKKLSLYWRYGQQSNVLHLIVLVELRNSSLSTLYAVGVNMNKFLVNNKVSAVKSARM